jgi:hypothetical protein
MIPFSPQKNFQMNWQLHILEVYDIFMWSIAIFSMLTFCKEVWVRYRLSLLSQSVGNLYCIKRRMKKKHWFSATIRNHYYVPSSPKSSVYSLRVLQVLPSKLRDQCPFSIQSIQLSTLWWFGVTCGHVPSPCTKRLLIYFVLGYSHTVSIWWWPRVVPQLLGSSMLDCS